ncbi:MAG TPA: biotin--[acetyl-CoA-carboxylase] ligase, partial [Dermatophilaceae bacterium]|nr:biotin--[acetyl-CoA-carboxylase] ligase [Dermatophilaceae bacterium]
MRSPLEPEFVRAGLITSGQPWVDVEFHAALGSTNDRARALAAEAGRPWRVVLTDHQTGGRGRLGRTWQVPDRASIAVSALVPLADAAAAGWVPLLAGLALARAIRDVTAAASRIRRPLQPRLKWPNDVLLAEDGDRKVSGILCELVRLGDGYGVVVGAGVNVHQTRDELPVETATSLDLCGVVVRREDLVVAYLRHLAALLGPLGEG